MFHPNTAPPLIAKRCQYVREEGQSDKVILQWEWDVTGVPLDEEIPESELELLGLEPAGAQQDSVLYDDLFRKYIFDHIISVEYTKVVRYHVPFIASIPIHPQDVNFETVETSGPTIYRATAEVKPEEIIAAGNSAVRQAASHFQFE